MPRGMNWGAARERESVRREPSPSMPSLAQVEYIARLADDLGTTVANPPATAGEASALIDALRKRRARARRS
jgi:hypothetical protein